MERELRTIAPGTMVYSSDAADVGEVAQVGANYLLTRTGWFFVTERYIPFDAVTRIAADGIYLAVAKDQLDAMAWDHPPPAVARVHAGGADAIDGGERRATVAQGTAGTELEAGGASTMGGDHGVPTPVRPRDDTGSGERPAVTAVGTGTELGAFQEGTLEVRARHEELVVGKRARVVEEIVLTTTATERTETVQTTVRRTRVDIAEVAGHAPSEAAAADTTPVPVTRTAEEVAERTTVNPRKRGGKRRRR